MNAKILLAIPNLGHIHTDLVQWMLRNVLKPRDNVDSIRVMTPQGLMPHDSARNFLVRAFLQTDCTHLYFVDSDVIPPDDAIDLLLESDKDIVTGAYANMRKDPKDGIYKKQYHIYDRITDDDGRELITTMWGEGTQPIRRCGAGCLMIRREVLEKIGAPWFKFQYDEMGNMKFGEDIDFCRKAEAAGYTIYANFDVVCSHVKEVTL